jgi:hypothetical protein
MTVIKRRYFKYTLLVIKSHFFKTFITQKVRTLSIFKAGHSLR